MFIRLSQIIIDFSDSARISRSKIADSTGQITVSCKSFESKTESNLESFSTSWHEKINAAKISLLEKLSEKQKIIDDQLASMKSEILNMIDNNEHRLAEKATASVEMGYSQLKLIADSFSQRFPEYDFEAHFKTLFSSSF